MAQLDYGEIMKTIASLLCCTLLCTFVCHDASAATDVKVNLTARVSGIYDPANILGGQIVAGDVYTGSYSYDSTVQGWSTAPNAKQYQVWGNLVHMRLANGTTVFETVANNAWGTIEVFSNPPNTGGHDGFSIYLYNQRPLPNGASVNNILMQLRNEFGGAPDSTDLPTTAPDLQYWPNAQFEISGTLNDQLYAVYLRIETMTLEPPQVVEVSPGASRFLPQQRFDATLLAPVGSTIVSVQASANGAPVPLNYPGICTLAPPNSEGRPAILCPDAHTVLDAAATHIDWSVELAGGTTLHKSVEWQLIQ
jgi:hypothetical protein